MPTPEYSNNFEVLTDARVRRTIQGVADQMTAIAEECRAALSRLDSGDNYSEHVASLISQIGWKLANANLGRLVEVAYEADRTRQERNDE